MSKRKTKKEAKTEEVYAIAARLFATKGYHATRIQDIADELGMLKGSLYYYFDSKEDLLVRLVQSRLGEAHQVIRGIIEGEGDAAAKLTCAIQEHLRLYQQSAHIYALFYYENLSQINEATAQIVHRLTYEYERLWHELVQIGVHEGSFRPDLDVAITVKAIMGMCNSTLLWYNPHGRLTINAVAQVFSEIIRQGIEQRGQHAQ